MKAFRIVVLLFALTLGITAQEGLAPLTEVQKLQLQVAAKEVEIWQLRTLAAQTEFEKARTALKTLIDTVTPAGYVLNEKLEFVKVPK